MASLTKVGHGTKAAGGVKVKTVADYLGKDRSEAAPVDYTTAGAKFFQERFGIEDNDKDVDVLCESILEYCEKYTKDTLSKAGKPLADIGGFGGAARAFGALHGDRELGGVIYTLGRWFDTEERQERLAALIAARKVPAGKKGGKK